MAQAQHPRGVGGAIPIAVPTVRLRMDVGSWTYGQPLAAGTGDIYPDCSVDDHLVLMTLLGAEGYKAWLTVLKYAVVWPAEDGSGPMLEVHGYSAAWLQEVCGFGEAVARRANNALKRSKIIATTSMPGANGAAGKQRAIVTNIVGLAASLDRIKIIDRGRRPETIPQRLRTSGFGDSAPSAESLDTEPTPQVGAIPQEARNGSLSSESRKSSSPIPSNDSAAAAPLGVASNEEVAIWLPGVEDPSWASVRDAVTRTERIAPGSVAGAVEAIFRSQVSNAGRLVQALGLRIADDASSGPSSVAVMLATWTEESSGAPRSVTTTLAAWVVSLICSPGPTTTAAPWRVLRDAKVHLPADADTTGTAAVDVLAPRVLMAVTAGLHSQVKLAGGWFGAALRKSTLDWTPSVTALNLADLLTDITTTVSEGRHWIPPTPDAPVESEQAVDSATPGSSTDVPVEVPDDVPAPKAELSEQEAAEFARWATDNGYAYLARKGVAALRSPSPMRDAILHRWQVTEAG